MLSASDRRVARQTFWTGAMSAVQLPAGILLIAMNTRVLEPEGYGHLAVIIAATTLVHGLAALPGGETVMTFATRSVAEGRRDEAGAILRFTLALSLGMALLAYAAIAALSFAARDLLGIGESHVTAMLLYGLVGVFVATSSENLAVLRLADRMSVGLAVTLAATATRVGLVALAWWTGGGLSAVVTAYVAGAAVNGVALFTAAAAAAPRAGISGFLTSFSIRVPSEVMAFQTGVFGKTTLGHLSGNLDSILLYYFAGPASTGLYRAARRIVDSARLPFSVLVTSVHAEFSRQWYASDGAALRRTTLRFTLLATASAGVVFGALALLREPLTRLVLDDDFAGVAPLLLILIPGSFVAGSFAALSILPEATGRVKPSLVAHGVAFAAFLAVLVTLAPRLGAAGAAWANSVFLIVWCAVAAPYIGSVLRKSYGKRKDPQSAAAPPVSSARDFYADSRTREQHDDKFSQGKGRLDDHVVDDLVRRLFTRHLNREHRILEIGAYTGRITRKLARYTANITVSDTSPDILRKFHYPKTVLDLRSRPADIDAGGPYDAIISIGHQVSICNDIDNAIDVFDRLLDPDGVLVFDVWNDATPKRYDPPYPLEKRSRAGVQETLDRAGFALQEYRSGSRIPYVAPRAFQVLFGDSGNRLVFRLLAKLERLLFRWGLFDGREQTQVFIAVRTSAARGQATTPTEGAA